MELVANSINGIILKPINEKYVWFINQRKSWSANTRRVHGTP